MGTNRPGANLVRQKWSAAIVGRSTCLPQALRELAGIKFPWPRIMPRGLRQHSEGCTIAACFFPRLSCSLRVQRLSDGPCRRSESQFVVLSVFC